MIEQGTPYTVENGMVSFRIPIWHPGEPLDPIYRTLVRYRVVDGPWVGAEQRAAIAEGLHVCADRFERPENEHPLPRLAGQDPDADDTSFGQDMGDSIGAFYAALRSRDVPEEFAASLTRDYLSEYLWMLFGSK